MRSCTENAPGEKRFSLRLRVDSVSYGFDSEMRRWARCKCGSESRSAENYHFINSDGYRKYGLLFNILIKCFKAEPPAGENPGTIGSIIYYPAVDHGQVDVNDALVGTVSAPIEAFSTLRELHALGGHVLYLTLDTSGWKMKDPYLREP